ncbi:transporter substrate-binding domain-containing protein [Litorivita sp. NS0012-18]|uniref:transporter substrate-binding domain-containing protein n=1 Tax=Litorivita sp. NS0012-18 TaxID=3127655 RepID=UPI003109FBEE
MRNVLRNTAFGLVALACLSGQAFARCEDYVPQPKPQNASRDIVGQDLDQITERGWIDIALFEDFPPYSYLEGGKPVGIDVEIGALIADALGVEPKFRLVAAGENLEADLRNWVWKGPVTGGRVANVMMHIPYDSSFACRVEQVVFTGQYATEGIAIAYSEAAYPDGEAPVPAYFRFDTVGVENDSISDFYLTAFPGGQLSGNMRRYPATQDAMAALAAGEVKAVMGPRTQLEAGAAAGIKVHQPPLPGFSVGKWTLGTAVNFRYRALGYAVDDAIFAALDDGRIAAIYAKYGATWQAPER